MTAAPPHSSVAWRVAAALAVVAVCSMHAAGESAAGVSECAAPGEDGWSSCAGGVGDLGAPGGCGIDRLESMSTELFDSKYRGRRPFIIRARSDNSSTLGADQLAAKSARAWTRSGFVTQFGETAVGTGAPRTDGVRGTRSMKLADYIAEFMPANGSAPASEMARKCGGDASGDTYVFVVGRQFFESHTAAAAAIRAPGFAVHVGADFGRANVLSIGGDGSGFPFHLHGEAWLELLTGAKRWSLYSIDAVGSPPGGYSAGRPHTHWLSTVLPSLPPSAHPIECTQQPGEVIYVPAGWFHATRNIGNVSLNPFSSPPSVHDSEALAWSTGAGGRRTAQRGWRGKQRRACTSAACRT